MHIFKQSISVISFTNKKKLLWIVNKKWSIENWQLQLKHAFWFQKFTLYNKNALDIETNVISKISKIIHTWQLVVACFSSKLTLTSKENWIVVLKNEKQMSNLENFLYLEIMHYTNLSCDSFENDSIHIIEGMK